MSNGDSITITRVGPNDFTITQGENRLDKLCWDEMLGSVCELTHPAIGRCRYGMQAPDEHSGFLNYAEGAQA